MSFQQKYIIGTRVSIQNNTEAVILAHLESPSNSDYLVAYKRRDGSWSQMHIKHSDVKSLWSELIKVEFVATVSNITKSTVTLEFYSREILDEVSDKLIGKRVYVTLAERS